jgi:hypothetical protein
MEQDLTITNSHGSINRGEINPPDFANSSRKSSIQTASKQSERKRSPDEL